MRRGPDRRHLLRGIGAMLCAGGGLDPACAVEVASLRDKPVAVDRIWLKRGDGSALDSRFRRQDGSFDEMQVLLLSWFMRDLKDGGKAVWIEPRLFDLLAKVQTIMSAIHGAPLPITVTSGYRTPAHNAQLEGAARNSMHLYGYAADVKLGDYPPRATALAASYFPSGGIGIYDDFTHLDMWKTRLWSGERRRAGTSAPHPGTPPPPAG